MGRGGLLKLMWESWNDVFRLTLGPAERSLVSELRDHRNKWAHQEPFSGDDAYRALDSAGPLLTAVSAPQADDIEKMKMELLRLRFDEQVRSEKRKSAGTAIESAAAGNLKPWREVVTPHKDVASGRYQQAEFAADLWQVHLGEGTDEYQKPGRVLPPHLSHREPQADAGRRGAAPRRPGRRPGRAAPDQLRRRQDALDAGALPPVLGHRAHGAGGHRRGAWRKRSAKTLPTARRVVLVGNKISPGNPVTKPDGTVVRTLWGELAWQLGGKKAFARIQADDEKATSPGDVLRELFNEYGPCLILIDEWVAYARQLHDQGDLPAGGFETQFTFAQVLTESAKLAKNCLLVISLPASDTVGLAPRPGRRRGGGRPARARGARPAAQCGWPRRVLVAAGERRGGVRDRAAPAVRAAGRPGAVQGPRRGGAGLRRSSTGRSTRSFRPSAATPTTRSGSRRPIRSTRRSSTGSTPTGPRWSNSSAPAACCA